MTETKTERRYVLTRIAAGDYLLPSNDALAIWRLRHEPAALDGEGWSVYRWLGDLPDVPGAAERLADAIVDGDWTLWETWGFGYRTRKEAMTRALEATT